METKERNLESIGAGAMQCIADMVAALECDYGRLEELRDRLADCDEQGRVNDPLSPDELEELAELEKAAGDCESEDDARDRIMEDPLSLEVRSDWQTPGEELTPSEFCLLLGTGGPAVRIIGDVDERGQLSSPMLEVQDWGTPWTRYYDQDTDVLEAYIACFSL